MTNPFHTDPFRILFRFAGLGAIFYGAYIWRFVGASGNNALALYAAAPSWAFGLPLIIGGLLQFVGCCLYRRLVAGTGVFLNLWIFLAAEISCLNSHPTTGVPAYVIIAGFYLLFFYCVCCVPLPCAGGHRTP